MKKKIIIVGAKGQLGNEFQALQQVYSDFGFYYFDKEDMDIVKEEEVTHAITSIKPDYLVNCAAYTAVDKAEADADIAYSINAGAVKNLARACSQNHVRFLHVSTDYVFDGTASQPYTEDDPVNPANVYGQSKLKGEEEAIKNNKDSIIIRTAWVYSTYGNNFVKTMLRLMKGRPEINVVSDQYGTPTYAADLATAIMQIIVSQKWVPGIYHFSNDGIINWYEFALAIKEISGFSCQVHPIPTEQYPTPAKRPKYSALDKSKIQHTFGISVKPWKDSLEACLEKMPAEL